MSPFPAADEQPQPFGDDAMSGILNAPPGAMAPPAIPEPDDESEGLPEGWRPQDQFQKYDLRVNLDEAEQTELGGWISDNVALFLQTWADRRDNGQEWRDAANMMPNWPILDPRGGDSANEALWMAHARWPGLAIACISQQQSMTQQLLTPSPAFTPVPLQLYWSPDDVTPPYNLADRAPDVAKALQSVLDKGGWKQRCLDLLDEITKICPAAIKVERKFDEIFVMERTVRRDDALMADLLEAEVMSPVEAMMEATETTASGKPKVRRTWRPETICDEARWRVVRAEDYIRFPPLARYADDCWAMGELTTLTARDLQKRLDEPLSGYYRDAVQRLLDTPSDDGSLYEWVRDQYDREGAQDVGAPTEGDRPEYRQWFGVDLEVRGFLDGSKQEKRYLVTVHPPTKTLLRCVYLNDTHGRFNYVPVNLYGNKLTGMSLCERGAVLQESGDKILGDLHDLYSIMVGCGGSLIAEESAVPNWDALTFVPGRVAPVTRIDGIMPVPMAQNLPAAIQQGMALLESIWAMLQKLTSTSNITLGQESEHDQTATEATILFRQDAAIRETNAMTVALALGEAARLTALSEAQHCESPEYSWIDRSEDGQMAEAKIDPRLFGAPYQWVCSGMTGTSSPQVRFQKAMTVMGIVQQSPFLAPVEDIQWEALEEILQALDVPDYREWLAKAKAFREQAMLMQQMAEAQMLGQQQEMAAQGQANVEAERGLKQQQLDQQAGAQEQQVALKQGDQQLQALSLAAQLAQPKPAASNGKAKK